MATTVTYKGNTLTVVSNDTKTLLTAGMYIEDDFTLTDVSAGSLQDKTVTPTQSTQTISADAGYGGLGTVTVNPIPSNYGLITWDGSKLTVS